MSQFLKSGRAVLVASVLAAASMAMQVPARAATFNLDFGIMGGGSNFSFQIGKGGIQLKAACLTNAKMREELQDQDFEKIRREGRQGNLVYWTARYDPSNDYYFIIIHRCNGDSDFEELSDDEYDDFDLDDWV